MNSTRLLLIELIEITKTNSLLKFLFTLSFVMGALTSFENYPIMKWIKYELDPWIEVTATVYHAVESQCDKTPTITANGFKIKNPKKDRVVAVSRDLEKILDLDVKKGKDKIEIKGTGEMDGIWNVQDRMSKRWKKKVDLLVDEDYINRWAKIKIRKID